VDAKAVPSAVDPGDRFETVPGSYSGKKGESMIDLALVPEKSANLEIVEDHPTRRPESVNHMLDQAEAILRQRRLCPWLFGEGKPPADVAMTQLQKIATWLRRHGTISRQEAHIKPEYGINCVQLPRAIYNLKTDFGFMIDTVWHKDPRTGKNLCHYELRYFDCFGTHEARRQA
jgi:hypothetical protein